MTLHPEAGGEGDVFLVSEAWKAVYPGAAAGILLMRRVANPEHHPALDARKHELESHLRSRFAEQQSASLRDLPAIQAYSAHFRRYKKTYHVLSQLESVALRGRSIPRVAALVEAMFVAELKNLLLTAGHDLAALQLPVRLDVSEGDERYTLLNGQEQVLKPGDMMMADEQGVISSVLYGPDYRTRIRAETEQVFFAVYAPTGIGEEAVHRHLEDIKDNVLLIAPDAEVSLLQVF